MNDKGAIFFGRQSASHVTFGLRDQYWLGVQAYDDLQVTRESLEDGTTLDAIAPAPLETG